MQISIGVREQVARPACARSVHVCVRNGERKQADDHVCVCPACGEEAGRGGGCRVRPDRCGADVGGRVRACGRGHALCLGERFHGCAHGYKKVPWHAPVVYELIQFQSIAFPFTTPLCLSSTFRG